MNRQEKIESIRRGEAVIKNDMQGDERCVDVLNECEINEEHTWGVDGSINDPFYGVDEYGNFLYLTKSQLNNRSQILMSELVEVEKPTINKQYLETQLRIKNMLCEFLDSIREYEHEAGESIHSDERHSLDFVEIFVNSDNGYEYRNILNQHPTEPKEVFTVENLQNIMNNRYIHVLPPLADKLNQMAFDAYK